MNEERLIIMRMLEEGKITAQEAAQLLDALNAQEAQENAGAQAQTAASGHVGEKAGSLGARLGVEIGERFSKLGESFSVLDKLVNIASWCGSGAGAKFEVTEEFKGAFSAAREIDVELKTRNGSIVVEPWHEDGYKIVAVKKVAAADDAEAERLAADTVQVTMEDAAVYVHAKENQQVPSISLRAYLPASYCYNLNLHTTNGSIRLFRLDMKNARFATTNGSVKGSELNAVELIANSTNGSIKLDQSSATGLRISTTNGSIKWQGSALDAKLDTTNGSVRVSPQAPAARAAGDTAVADGDQIGYKVTTCNGSIHWHAGADLAQYTVRFHANTGHGRINADGPWVIERERKSPGSREMAGYSDGASLPAPVCEVQLRTSNGSVHIDRV